MLINTQLRQKQLLHYCQIYIMHLIFKSLALIACCSLSSLSGALASQGADMQSAKSCIDDNIAPPYTLSKDNNEAKFSTKGTTDCQKDNKAYTLSVDWARSTGYDSAESLRATQAQAPDKNESGQIYRQVEKFPCIVISSDTVQTAPSFTDKEFEAYSTKVIFKVGKADIRPDDDFFTLYRNEILPRINDHHLQLRKVIIRGAASPEGSYALNSMLAQRRAQALLQALKQGLENQYIEMDSEISCITEDYGYLLLLMEKAGDPDFATVKSIVEASCTATTPAAIPATIDEQKVKKALQKHNKGLLWKRLLKEYFPTLRSARMILWFSEPDEEHAPLLPVAKADIRPVPRLMAQETALVSPAQYVDSTVREPALALKTNLVHDFFFIPSQGVCFSPNLQLEYFPQKGRWSYNLGFTWGNWRRYGRHSFFQVRDLQFEVRRYFKMRKHEDRRFEGFFAGAVLEANMYGIGLDAKRGAQGEGIAASLCGGWSKALTRNGDLRLELSIALGAYFSLYDPYVYGNPVTGVEDGKYYYNYLGNASSFRKRNHLFTWLGPTNIGIQLSYNIIHRERKIRTRIPE